MHNPEDDTGTIAKKLLLEAGCRENFTVNSFGGGGNNKVYVLDIAGTPAYLIKRYFRHSADPRDRCKAEWTFLEYAADARVSCVPAPVACDLDRGVAIYQYIPGEKISSGFLKEDHIVQAMDFFYAINRPDRPDSVKKIQPAAEACFSSRDHMESVNRRLKRLLQIRSENNLDKKAYRFVCNELIPCWEQIKTSVLNDENIGKMPIDQPLEIEDVCISPSDFGFHNSILTWDERLYFIDFEYSGLDDPVKMICDFFCQPEVPVPQTYLPMVCDRVLGRLSDPEFHRARVRKFMPVHTLKWCCILLNEFLPLGIARRVFANSSMNVNTRKEEQLKKAEKMLQQVHSFI